MMPIDRRQIIAGAVGLAAATQVSAELSPSSWPPRDSFRLWPGRAPNAPKVLPKPDFTLNGDAPRRELWLRGVVDPIVGVYRPANPDGRALLAIPGGGYEFVSVENEGINVAKTFNPRGVTVFVLGYRLPGEGWLNSEDVVLQDGQRAMRLIRARAREFGINAATLGCVGFSAGGLLAASLAVAHDDPVYDRVDAADAGSAKPAYAGLIYPVITGDKMRIGKLPAARFDTDRRVRPDTPPLFIVHALDDNVVPLAQPMAMLEAARAAGVKTEAHFFQEGGHGFGPAYLPPTLPGSRWPELFDLWIRRQLAG